MWPQDVPRLVFIQGPEHCDQRHPRRVFRNLDPDPVVLVPRFSCLVIKADGDPVFVTNHGLRSLAFHGNLLSQVRVTVCQDVVHLQDFRLCSWIGFVVICFF